MDGRSCQLPVGEFVSPLLVVPNAFLELVACLKSSNMIRANLVSESSTPRVDHGDNLVLEQAPCLGRLFINHIAHGLQFKKVVSTSKRSQ